MFSHGKGTKIETKAYTVKKLVQKIFKAEIETLGLENKCENT